MAKDLRLIQPRGQRGFAELLQPLTPEQRTQVHNWYRRVGAPSMADATAAQIAWMRARHYPMPADIARATSMSNPALQKAAEGGDTVARMFLVMRLAEDVHDWHAAGKNRAHVPSRAFDGICRMMPQILASGSPYAGYLYAASERLRKPSGRPAYAAELAGLVWASRFGDTRARQLLALPAVQAVDAGAASSSISLMVKYAMLHNPRLFTRPVTPIPPRDR